MSEHWGRERYAGTCPCGRRISTNRATCLACAEAGPIRHAGVRLSDGVVLFTAGGLTDVATLVKPNSRRLLPEQVARRARAIVGHMPYMVSPAGTQPAVIDGRPVEVEVLEMVYNDRATINAILGEGTYEALCNDRERRALTIALEIYGAGGTHHNEQRS